MTELTTTFRHAVRRLAHRPGFTAAAVATLALGIGVNVAVFSAFQAVLLAPLPYPNPDRMVEVDVASDDLSSLSAPDFVDLHDGTDAFEGLFAAARSALTLSDGDRPAELVQGSAVTGDFFRVMETSPALGRPFTREEVDDPENRAVLLGHDLWQRRYGADPSVVGSRIEIDGRPTLVAGVMPAGFAFPHESEIWAPLAIHSDDAGERGSHYLDAYGRLAPGVSLAQADAQARSLSEHLASAWPDTNSDTTFRVGDLREALVGTYRPVFLMLLGATGLVLLIACANLANLLLARMIERRRELAVRSALGAASSGLLRLVLAESLLLAALGGAAALVVGWAGLEALTSFDVLDIPRLSNASLDPAAVLLCLAVTAVTALVAGAVPALRLGASRTLHTDLLSGGSATGDRASHRLRAVLVGTEITLAVVLLFGAGLLGRSLLAMERVDPGFNPDGALTFSMSLNDAEYPESAQKVAFTDRLIERLSALPGVERAGLILGLPMAGPNMVIQVEQLDGAPAYSRPEQARSIWTRPITPDVLSALGIPVVAGRGLTERDRPGAPPAVLVNETAARMFWPDDDNPLGHTIQIGATIDGSPVGGEVVGVVGDVHGSSVAEAPVPELYLPYGALPFQTFTVVLRTPGDPAALTAAARSVVDDLDPRLAIYRVRTMRRLLSGSLAQSRLYALLLSVFAATALVLAAVGIYGVVSYAASQRTREMGIRMALGASRRRVVALMLRLGLGMTAAGAVAGLLAAITVSGLLRTWLYGLEPTDPLTLGAAVLVLSAVAVLACVAPARAAARTDPAVTLRQE